MGYKDYSNQEENEGTKWNFDDSEFQFIFELKVAFASHLQNWELEKAFWKLKLLYMECYPLLDDTEKEQTDISFTDLDTIRNNYNSMSDQTEAVKGEYYIALEEIYKRVCQSVKEHGGYFRENKDYDGL